MNAGKPCLGAWLAYGLGSMNDNLPTFIVLQTKTNPKENNQPVSSRLWSSGFLSSEFAGVGLRSGGRSRALSRRPAGVDRDVRREMLDTVEAINRQTLAEVATRKPMRASPSTKWRSGCSHQCPNSRISARNRSLRGISTARAKQPGTFAYNCLLARRMAERGVRFTQIYKRGWDVHGDVVGILPILCQETDRGAMRWSPI